MIKKYITWNRKKINDNRYTDPNTDNLFENSTTAGTFHETPYQIADWRFISWIEYPELTTEERINELITAHSDFNFTFITEAEANTFLESLADDTGWVTVSNFIFSDTRVFDLI